jgi:hypothetical protein
MATTPDQKLQELTDKLVEYCNCSTQATTQVTKDVETINQCLNDLEKTIQATITTTITQAMALKPTSQVINIPPPQQQVAFPAAQTPKVPKPHIEKFDSNSIKYTTWKFQVTRPT